ncbi:hypothetical protein AAEX28_01385 [Lentisphaerota bacterium WC36G]|nr:hypothetical protein LJT99_04270 [Lentisphaerae bacterium WC36]
MKKKKIYGALIALTVMLGSMIFLLGNSDENYSKLKQEVQVENSIIKENAIDFCSNIIKIAHTKNSASFSKSLNLDHQLGEVIYSYAKNLTSNNTASKVSQSKAVKNYIYVYYKNNTNETKFQLHHKNNKWQLLNIIVDEQS